MHFVKSEVSRWEMLGIIWHAYQIPLLCKKRIIHVDIDLVDVSIPPFLSVKSFLLQGHLYLEWQYWHIAWISTRTTSSGIHVHEFKFHLHTGIFSSVEDRFILCTLYTPWLFSENILLTVLNKLALVVAQSEFPLNGYLIEKSTLTEDKGVGVAKEKKMKQHFY